MRSNKKLGIVISIVLALAVAGSVIAYLYFMTDTFKSKQELFFKYFSQNIDVLKEMTDSKTAMVYGDLKNKDKYESNTKVTMVNSEGGEISDPLNNLSMALDIQKNDGEQYLYADGKILYEDKEYLEAEILKRQDEYGIRFTEVVQQFVSIKDDDNLETVAKNLGVEKADLQKIIYIIDGKQSVVDMQQVNDIKSKCSDVLIENISQGIFSKQKKAMITYNNVTTETNAYTVALNTNQVQGTVEGILNNVKNLPIDLDISKKLEDATLRVTIYEKNKTTLRTVIEIGLHKITIENVHTDKGLSVKIEYINNDNSVQIEAVANKENTEMQEKYEMVMNVMKGEKAYTVTFLNQMKVSDNKIELETELSHKENITEKAIKLKNDTVIGEEFEIVPISDRDNMVLNDLKEEKMKDIIFILNQVVPPALEEREKVLKRKFELREDDDTEKTNTNENEEEVEQVEINKFNSKFEFYTGDEVSAENVKMLLDIVKKHLANYEEIKSEQETELSGIDKIKLKLKIEKDVLNEELANQISEKIKIDEKYKVSITYKEENGLIDCIMIEEV